MSIPSAGYALATPQNPSSAQVDFTFIIDLSLLPQSWWDDVNTTDATRGRAAKNDGTTELPVDWISFDSTAQTGLARIKYSGTKSASISEPVRIYAPNTRNTAYAAGDTYGQYNAYGSTVQGSYPFGGGDDRTSNQNNLTMYGSPTVGGDTVFGFPATNYDGATQYGLSAQLDFGGERNASMFTAFNADALSGGLGGQWDNGLYWVIQSDGDILGAIRTTSGNAFPASSDGPVAINASHTACLTYEPGSLSVYVDGTIKATASSATGDLITPNNDFQISGYGGGTELFNGGIAFYEVYFDAISSGYQSYLTSQISDNSTFWGSPTWVSGSTGYTIDADAGSFSLTGYDAGLQFGHNLSAEHGTFSLTGFDITLTPGRVLSADTGAHILTGQDVNLLFGHALQADPGDYALTGYDADLTYAAGLTLNAETGNFNLTGFDIGLIVNRTIETEAGAFVLTGYDAELNVLTGYTLDAEPGDYTLTGEDITILRQAVITAQSGAYQAIGYPATLTYSGEVILNPDIITVPGEITLRLSTLGEIQRSLTIKGELS